MNTTTIPIIILFLSVPALMGFENASQDIDEPQGQFKLTQLANGHTFLEGTTWYINKINPHIYWTVWSDYIVHKIHKRVLEHIKTQAEQQSE